MEQNLRSGDAEAAATGLPAEVADMIGRRLYPATAEFEAELGYGWNMLSATENGNPLYWDEAVAGALTGGRILPLSTLSLWMRPHRWAPGARGEQLALQSHFDLKGRFGLHEAIISDNTAVFYEPVRPGDVISHRQVLRSVSGPKTTRLGSGRFWVIDVEYSNQHGALAGVESYTGLGYRRPAAADPEDPPPSDAASPPTEWRLGPAAPPAAAPTGNEPGQRPEDPPGAGRVAPPAAVPASGARAKPDPCHDQIAVGDALDALTHRVTATTVVLGAVASRDWRPMHHDYRFATERSGTRDIFVNTPTQLAWLERAVTDWTGPRGRLGRVSFRMRDSVFPGEEMTVSATVTGVPTDAAGCGWAELDLVLRAGARICTTGTARVALPMSASDNPWTRRGDAWLP